MSDQPPAIDADDRPWEQPGAIRRDWEPHRGPVLESLGTASLVLGALSVPCSFLSPLVAPAGLAGAGLGLAAVGLSLAAGVPAWRDLQAMDTNRTDPGGRQPSARGLSRGRTGFLLGWIGILVFLVFAVSAMVTAIWR